MAFRYFVCILFSLYFLPVFCWGRVVKIGNNTDVQEQFIEDSVVYIVSSNIDLKGKTLSIPENSVLKFTGKGSFNNGIVKGENTVVEGLVRVRFSNVQFTGSFNLSSFSYIAFGEYTDDTKLLQAMFDLLFLSRGKCTLWLEKKRIYNVDSDTKCYAHAIYEYNDVKQKKINGNEAVINDLRSRSKMGYKTYDGVFLFSNCHDIKINNLNYQNLNEDYMEICEGGILRYKAGIENQIGYVGSSFILLQNDCSNIDISSDIVGARYGVKSGSYSMFWLCGSYGLKNSKLNIRANRTGYPVAIEVGDSLDIFVHSVTHHRAAYLCGITNSNIEIEAKDIYIAPFHCLLSDTHYSKGDSINPLFKSCSNLNVKFTELGSTIATNGDCYCVGFQTYNNKPFFSRTKKLIWENININVKKAAQSDVVGLFCLSRNYPNNFQEPLGFNDEYRNILVVAEDMFPTNQYCFRVRVNEYGVYDNIHFEVKAPHAAVIYDNCSDYSFDLTKVNVSQIYYSGKVRKKKSSNAKLIQSTLKNFVCL